MLKRILYFGVLPLVFLLALLLFAASYTVRFNEDAVVTTFGKASENAVKEDPGFYVRWPYPISKVTKYDTRTRIVETRSETQLTRDDFQLVVESFLFYRVSDPLVFYQRFGNAGDRSIDHFRQAEDVIRDRLRSALGEVSSYTMNELFKPVKGESKLTELETRIEFLLESRTDNLPPADGDTLGDDDRQEITRAYGIEIMSVGISRVRLPEDTTAAVIDRMGANRDKLSKDLESRGESRARAIVAQANEISEKIRRFAERRSAEIIAQGEREAAPFLAAQRTNEDLAIFLQKLELMKEAMGKRITLVLPIENYGIDLFSPETMRTLRPGQIPSGAGSLIDVDFSLPDAAAGEGTGR